jgi:hypothetical protein
MFHVKLFPRMMMTKEIAKFLAGLTAWEAVVHGSLAACDLLPMKWCGFTLTVTMNAVQVLVPALVSMLLVWYGWFYKPHPPTITNNKNDV